jgi:hypothetical protein
VDVCPKCQRSIPDGGDFCPHCAPVIDEFKAEGAAPVQAYAAEPADTPRGIGRREIILMAAAVIGSGAITLAALSAGGGSSSPDVTAAVTPGPGAARPAAATPAPSATWVENGRTWMGNARKGIALELAARNETSVWMRTVRPLLVVRCVDKRTDVFVFTDSAAAMEAKDEDHTVRIAVDSGSERSERWPDSSAHDALFAPDGRRLLQEIGQARTFSFGYTPHNAGPVVAHFDVAGLRERLGSAARYCQP